MNRTIHECQIERVQGDILERASRLALRTTREVLQELGAPRLVRFVLFDEEALNAFRGALDELV